MNMMLRLRPLVVAACALGLGKEASAQVSGAALRREQATALVRSSYVQIDGRQTPELVPYAVRMMHFFDLYIVGRGGLRGDLRESLTAEDEAILAHFAESEHAQVKQAHERQYTAAWLAIASRAKDMSAMEIAGEFKALQARFERDREASYRAVLAQLSEAGRRIVSDFAYARIKPMVAVEDPFVVANAAPDFYKAQIIGLYELHREGKMPEPPTSLGAAAESSQQGLELEDTGEAQMNSDQ